jgi:hypothetical protein
MSHVFACAAPAHPAWHRHEPAASTASQRGAMPACNGADDATRDAAFVALQAAYRGHGGIASGDSLAARLDRAGRGGYLDLARRIVAGDLFSFRWNDAFWVPLFQFDPVLLTLRAAPRRVLAELHGALDGWAIANWHVRAHDDLHGQRPLDLLDTELSAVLAAARADRCAADV